MRVAALTLLLLAMSSLASAQTSWQTLAEGALRAALESKHPEVDAWSLVPLMSERQRAFLHEADAPLVQAIQLGKRSSVRLTWEQGGRRAATIWFAVQATRPALVMRAQARAGAALSVDAVEIASVDALDPTCKPISAPAALVGMRARKTLRVGVPVCAQAVERRPPVSRGEEVTVTARSGRITITTKAIAEQDGAIGESLRVKNPASGDIYVASVSGQGEVVVP